MHAIKIVLQHVDAILTDSILSAIGIWFAFQEHKDAISRLK